MSSSNPAAAAIAHFENDEHCEFLNEIIQTKLNCYDDPDLKEMVTAAADIIAIDSQIIPLSYVANFITATKDWKPNPSLLLREDTVIKTLGMMIGDGFRSIATFHHPKEFILALKKTWGDDESFVQDASAFVAVAMRARIAGRIEERKREDRRGAMSLGDTVESCLSVFPAFPELLKQSHHPVAEYLEFCLSRNPTKDAVVAMSSADLAAHFIKAGVDVEGFTEESPEELRKELLEEIEDSSLLEKLEPLPTLLSQVQTYCLLHPNMFPFAAHRFGYKGPVLSRAGP